MGGFTDKETKVRVWVGVTDHTPQRRPRSGSGWVFLIPHHTGDQGQGLGGCHSFHRPRSGFGWVSLIPHHTGDQGHGLGWVGVTDKETKVRVWVGSLIRRPRSGFGWDH